MSNEPVISQISGQDAGGTGGRTSLENSMQRFAAWSLVFILALVTAFGMGYFVRAGDIEELRRQLATEKAAAATRVKELESRILEAERNRLEQSLERASLSLTLNDVLAPLPVALAEVERQNFGAAIERVNSARRALEAPGITDTLRTSVGAQLDAITEEIANGVGRAAVSDLKERVALQAFDLERGLVDHHRATPFLTAAPKPMASIAAPLVTGRAGPLTAPGVPATESEASQFQFQLEPAASPLPMAAGAEARGRKSPQVSESGATPTRAAESDKTWRWEPWAPAPEERPEETPRVFDVLPIGPGNPVADEPSGIEMTEEPPVPFESEASWLSEPEIEWLGEPGPLFGPELDQATPIDDAPPAPLAEGARPTNDPAVPAVEDPTFGWAEEAARPTRNPETREAVPGTERAVDQGQPQPAPEPFELPGTATVSPAQPAIGPPY